MESHRVFPEFLLRTILLQRSRWRVAILIVSFFSALFGVFAPYAQKHFIDGLMHEYPAGKWMWSAFGLTLAAHALGQFGVWLAVRESLVTQKSLSDEAYRRVLLGPGGLVGRRPAGEAVSLFAVDVPGAAAILDQALVMAVSMVFPLMLAPIALHAFFAIPWLSSFGAILVLALFNFVLARKQSRFFYSFKQLAAERTGLVAEWIQNIRALRILGWVKAIESRIFEVRERETQNRLRMVTNGQIMNSLASSATFVLNILAVLLLLKIRGGINARPTPGELLSLLWVLGVFLAKPLRQFPWALVISMDAYSSMIRLQKALNLSVEQPRVLGALLPSKEAVFALEVRKIHLESEGRTLIDDVDLAIRAGEFVAIVGEVGSGKSLLLQSLMGATGATFAQYWVDGVFTQGPADPKIRERIAYVPQEGFTMSASLRENVMFTYLDGRDSRLNEELDAAVLNSLTIAQFNPETERVADGLETEIGERGVNLSGGQRQRVGIARAYFADRSFIFLDDCLSAVDVDTESRLVEELICGAWKNCTRLLATHRMSVLPKCDRILFMQNGKISHQGRFEELFARVPAFQEFVRRGDAASEVPIASRLEEASSVTEPSDG